MDRATWISVGLGLALLVLLWGCVQPPASGAGKEKAYVPPEEQASAFDPLTRCQNLTYSKQQECIEQLAVQGHYPKLCEELNARNRVRCLRNTAIDALNPDFCQGIQHVPTRDSCYKTVALLSKKFEPCALMSTASPQDQYSKNDCYRSIAKDTANEAACAYITEEAIDKDHFRFHRDQCYWQVFEQTKAAKLCNKFLDPNQAAACNEQARRDADAA